MFRANLFFSIFFILINVSEEEKKFPTQQTYYDIQQDVPTDFLFVYVVRIHNCDLFKFRCHFNGRSRCCVERFESNGKC